MLWSAGEEGLQGIMSRVYDSQASVSRDTLQTKVGREKETSLRRESFMLLILEKAASPWKIATYDHQGLPITFFLLHL